MVRFLYLKMIKQFLDTLQFFTKSLIRFNDFGTLENIDYDFKSKLFETFLERIYQQEKLGTIFYAA